MTEPIDHPDSRASGDDNCSGTAGPNGSGAESPFTPPRNSELREPLETDPSVFLEPWMKGSGRVFESADEPLADLRMSGPAGEPEQSVWDEPGLSPQLSGDIPPEGLTWLRWYEAQVRATSVAQTWLVTLLVAAVSGVGAVVGVFLMKSMTTLPLVMVVLIGPVTEEILKVAVIAWVCEKRPWLFSSTAQIVLCGVVSGLAFAAVENLIYLNIHVPNPSAALIAWRWTVCVGLHTGCSTIAAIGIVRVWQKFQRERRSPRLADGAPWIVAAVILHSLYNFAATLMETLGVDF